MSVRALDPSLSSEIRSAHTVDSVPQCVVELVQNSVDACASSVVVKVDTSSWRIQVTLSVLYLETTALCISYIMCMLYSLV